MGLSNELSCEAGSFSCYRFNLHRCFQLEVLRLYFPALGPWVVGMSHSPVVPPSLSARKCGTTCSARPSPPANALLRVLSTWLPVSTTPMVWVSVSSLSPWLSDFHTVRFSGSSHCFLVFKFVVVFLLVMSTYASILAGSQPSNALSFRFL